MRAHMRPGREEAARGYTEAWCAGGEIGYVELPGGGRVRYLRAGSGPPLVLLHTVRTQLDHFQLVIPQIVDAFTVYAIDLPGMGWSDIVPAASYEEPALRAAVVRVVERLDLSDLTLAGESMGATLSLTASTDLGGRVRRIIAVNTYDFADGIKRGNLLARVIVSGARAPGIGPVVTRMENKALLTGMMRGGLRDPRKLPPEPPHWGNRHRGAISARLARGLAQRGGADRRADRQHAAARRVSLVRSSLPGLSP